MITQENYDGSKITGDHYRCVGSVRGWCGHKHRSLDAAVRCRRGDDNGCALQGGYSDRVVYLYAGNKRQGVAEPIDN